MKTEDLSVLRIHQLKSEEQFDRAKEEGRIEDDSFYLTPDISAGEKTPEGGEIFNDYENNEAIGDFTRAVGKNSKAGIRGYKPTFALELNNEKTLFYIDIDNRGVYESYSEGDLLCFDGENHVYNKLRITGIYRRNPDDDNDNRIRIECDTVDGNPIEGIRVEYSEDPWENWVYCIAKPNPIGGIPVQSSEGAYAGGVNARAIGRSAYAFGRDVEVIGDYGHAEGRDTKATYAAHAEGKGSEARGYNSHAEGALTRAIGDGSHAEGYNTFSYGNYSHAEGWGTEAHGLYAHTEGNYTKTNNDYTHAEGNYTEASGLASHSQGNHTKALGDFSNTRGDHTIAESTAQDVSGSYNLLDKSKLMILGNGGEVYRLSGESSKNLVSNIKWHRSGLNGAIIPYEIDPSLNIPSFILKSDGGSNCMVQSFDCKSYSIINVTLKYKCLSGTNNAYVRLYFYDNENCNPPSLNYYDVMTNSLQDYNNWNTVTIRCVAPVGSIKTKLEIGNNSGVVTEYCVADISLTEIRYAFTENFEFSSHDNYNSTSRYLSSVGWTPTGNVDIIPNSNVTNNQCLKIDANSSVRSPIFDIVSSSTDGIECKIIYTYMAEYHAGEGIISFYDYRGHELSDSSIALDLSVTGENEWKHVVLNITAPKSASYAYIRISGSGGPIYIDEITVTDESGHAYVEYSNAFTVDWDGNAWFGGTVTETCKHLPDYTDLNDITQNGLYHIGYAGEHAPPTVGFSYIRVIGNDSNTLTQFIFQSNTSLGNEKTIIKRTKWLGTWGEWEWINPPLHDFHEYRTTEMYGGEPVYVMKFGFGGLPSNGTKNPDCPIKDISRFIRYDITADFASTGQLFSGYSGITALGYDHSKRKLFLTTNTSAYADIDVCLTLWYTKST